MSLIIEMDGDSPKFFQTGDIDVAMEVTVRMFQKNPLEYTQEILQVYEELEPIHSKMKQMVLETTQAYADGVRRYLWMLPFTLDIKVINYKALYADHSIHVRPIKHSNVSVRGAHNS
jgi:hypothetical protein